MPLPRFPLAFLFALLGASCQAQSVSEPFDWSLLEGRWAESADHAYGCRKDNLHFTFAISADRSRLTFKLDRPWPIAGQQVTEYSAQVTKAAGRTLLIRYGEELKNIPAEMREWELRFIGPGTYRWRASSWPANQFNTVIGVKCNAN